MTQLDEALLDLKRHDGVEHVLLVGTDGLLVRHVGESGGVDPDRVSAMLPGILSAASALGQAAGDGDASTIVLELEDGVGIIAPLSKELMLGLLIRRGIAFPELLRGIRRDRGRLAALV